MEKGLTADGLAGESRGSEGEAVRDWEEAYQIAYWEGYAACQLELQQLQGYAPRGQGGESHWDCWTDWKWNGDR